jgi:hypothetical protein
MNSSYHTYGQQLGWHALFLVAGRLMRKYPHNRRSVCGRSLARLVKWVPAYPS